MTVRTSPRRGNLQAPDVTVTPGEVDGMALLTLPFVCCGAVERCETTGSAAFQLVLVQMIGRAHQCLPGV